MNKNKCWIKIYIRQKKLLQSTQLRLRKQAKILMITNLNKTTLINKIKMK